MVRKNLSVSTLPGASRNSRSLELGPLEQEMANDEKYREQYYRAQTENHH
jgi:hypothetical protein